MAGILVPAVEKYLSGVIPERDGVLQEMEAYARKHDVPIIGPECGRLLYLLTQISGAKRIFEMGSAIGYSAMWFALAAGPHAEIYYTDGDPKNADMARTNLGKAGVLEQVHILTGDAIDLIDGVSGEFDIILIDVLKHQYPAALKKSLRRVKQGGLIIADNVLWSGKVVDPAVDDADTRAIRAFNEKLKNDARVWLSMLPIRDGLTLASKKG